jgi:hypothetical protein
MEVILPSVGSHTDNAALSQITGTLVAENNSSGLCSVRMWLKNGKISEQLLVSIFNVGEFSSSQMEAAKFYEMFIHIEQNWVIPNNDKLQTLQ